MMCLAQYLDGKGKVILTCNMERGHHTYHFDPNFKPDGNFWCVQASVIPDGSRLIQLEYDATTG